MANSPGAQELMTFASGPALVKWPQHLQQEHGDCQRKFGLISSSSTPPPAPTDPNPPLTFSASLPPFQSLCLSPHFFCLEFVNPSGFLLCTSLFLFLLHHLLRAREGQTESPSPAQPITMARQTSVFTPLV